MECEMHSIRPIFLPIRYQNWEKGSRCYIPYNTTNRIN